MPEEYVDPYDIPVVKRSPPLVHDVTSIVAERGATHGPFGLVSSTAQRIKQTYRESPNWELMPAYMQEALDNIATKQARILNGDWEFLDHWDDVQGYARRVVQEVEEVNSLNISFK
jgi:hypothetical protein